MKKIFIGILFLLGTMTYSFADAGLNVGITGTAGLFETSATEKENDETFAKNNQGHSELQAQIWKSSKEITSQINHYIPQRETA